MTIKKIPSRRASERPCGGGPSYIPQFCDSGENGIESYLFCAESFIVYQMRAQDAQNRLKK